MRGEPCQMVVEPLVPTRHPRRRADRRIGAHARNAGSPQQVVGARGEPGSRLTDHRRWREAAQRPEEAPGLGRI